MKLQEMDGFLKGKCLPGDMLVNETHAEYLVRKFAELQSALDVQSARSDALAAKLNDVCAESAALKKFIREKCFVVPDGASCFAEADECAEKRMPETPNTDAWVNEQRAHDLNAFIHHHSEKLDAHIRNGGEQLDSKSNELRNLIVSARLFREQLRGGQV